jgi:iron only hydrogenase large subunit-like protein
MHYLLIPHPALHDSLVPLLAAGEADRPWFSTDGHHESRDIDHVITTVELAQMFVEKNIDLVVRLLKTRLPV